MCTRVASLTLIHARMTLVQHGFYGSPEDSLGMNLRRGFRDFEMWRKAKKLQCTQGVWTPGLVTGFICAQY